MRIKNRESLTFFFPILLILCIGLLTLDSSAIGQDKAAVPPGAQAGSEKEVQKTAATIESAPNTGRLVREGLSIEFSAKSSKGYGGPGNKIYAGDYVDINFRITDAATGEPLQGQFPGAWMDMGETVYGKQKGVSTCRERAGLYLQGLVGIRPLIDLNSFYLLVMS